MLKRPLRFVKKHKITSAVLLILILVGGFFVYQRVVLELNKRAFAHARAAIDTVYADIVSQVGVPDDSKTIELCTQRYQEFTGYSDTTCHIDKSFIYGVVDKTDANILFKKIQSIINSNSQFKPTRSPASSITDSLAVNTYYHAASDKYKASGLDCVVNYVYDTPREIDLGIKDKNKKPFEITVGCYGPARQAYYPLSY